MAPLIAALPGIAKLVAGIVDKAVPDKDLAERIKAEARKQILDNDSKEMEAAANIIMAEAKSEHWLTSSWRPITMLVFTALVVARWLGLTVDIPPEIESELWTVIQLGIGGYVMGRSGEKIAQQLSQK